MLSLEHFSQAPRALVSISLPSEDGCSLARTKRMVGGCHDTGHMESGRKMACIYSLGLVAVAALGFSPFSSDSIASTQGPVTGQAGEAE